MNRFTEILSFRHACKLFAEDKPVSEADKRAIVEFGRLSPSSYGIEPWHFLVISDKVLREKLRPFCWNQPQITSASFIVIYLVKQAYNFRTDKAFVKQRLLRRCGDDAERYQMISKMVANYLSEQNTLDWARRQSYIALANMLSGAASLGIDSCPIEGFESENVKSVLSEYVDWSQYDTSVIAAFGYRVNPQPEKIREPMDSIATFI